MGKLVQLVDPPTDHSMLFDLDFGWAGLDRFWRIVLAVAVRDEASSVQYHPWRAIEQLSYVVGGVRYEMVPPRAELARRLATVASSLVCSNRLGTASRRWLGWPLRASGRVRLVRSGVPSEWAGVIWSVGTFIGVEWYRLDLAP